MSKVIKKSHLKIMKVGTFLLQNKLFRGKNINNSMAQTMLSQYLFYRFGRYNTYRRQVWKNG
ncbi:MAG: hypothetical protein APF81_14170 [Desulfosporosinus sp. BRH_c37]|nr:MAG: hypothetical protein APF81_14170 [Desulfosporosinus sp. BRH_c37]